MNAAEQVIEEIGTDGDLAACALNRADLVSQFSVGDVAVYVFEDGSSVELRGDYAVAVKP